MRVLEAAGPLLPEPLDSLLDKGVAAEGEEGDEGHEGEGNPDGEQLCSSEGEVGSCNREEPCEILLVFFNGWKYQIFVYLIFTVQRAQEDCYKATNSAEVGRNDTEPKKHDFEFSVTRQKRQNDLDNTFPICSSNLDRKEVENIYPES